LPPTYFAGVVGAGLGVVLVPEFEVGVLGVVELPDLEPEELEDPELPEVEPEELDEDPVVLLEAVLEALAGAVGVVPAGVVNIGTVG
jgi:hypothetical protein